MKVLVLNIAIFNIQSLKIKLALVSFLKKKMGFLSHCCKYASEVSNKLKKKQDRKGIKERKKEKKKERKRFKQEAGRKREKNKKER